MITIEGHIQHVTYRNEENHYMVAKFNAEKTRSTITVVGYIAGVEPGESLSLTGNWDSHPKYGQQFKIDSYEVILPVARDGIVKYLASGIVRGIGLAMAEKMVDRFGEETFSVIENEPERLLQIRGIGKSKLAMIVKSWEKHHALRGLMNFLQENKVQPTCCGPIFRDLGVNAVEKIRQNPFRIIGSISWNGFNVADTMAENLGFPFDSPLRIEACLLHILDQQAGDGNVFTDREVLVSRCMEMTGAGEELISDTLKDLRKKRKVFIEKADADDLVPVYLRELYDAEKGIASKINALLSMPAEPPAMDRDSITTLVMNRLAIKLSEEQLSVVEEVLEHRAVVITGGPGTGKTTLVRSITSILKEADLDFLLAAPTGRAARRLSEVTGEKASTIHKLLGYNFLDGSFERNQDNPFEPYAIIIDEVSMVDTLLMHHLLKAVSLTSVLILVGDVFQLPSVGPGNVLSDLIGSGVMKTFKLTEIFRQAQESSIVVNAHKVRHGENPDHVSKHEETGLSDFYFIEQNHPETVVSSIVEMCCNRIPKVYDYIDDIQVLTPMHRGEVGTINLNQVLQSALNSNPMEVEVNGVTYKIGDKVMHLKNNYTKDVFNGDIGRVCALDKKEKTLSVDYDGRSVEYEFTELDELTLAYAISVHKSQGSEYPAVIVPLQTQHFPLLQRNLIYTAITRGKDLVILIGTRKALSIALQNDKPRLRLSGLKKKLIEI